MNRACDLASSEPYDWLSETLGYIAYSILDAQVEVTTRIHTQLQVELAISNPWVRVNPG